MGVNTGIEWCHHSWNPWQGCNRIAHHPGCVNCYMHREMKRFGRNPSQVVRSSNNTFNLPRSNRVGAGERVFVCSWSDFFHIDVHPDWRAEAWEIMRQRSDVTFIIPTKRPDLIEAMLPPDWGEGWENIWLGVSVSDQVTADNLIYWLLDVPARIRFISAEPLLGPIDLERYLNRVRSWEPEFGEPTLRGHASTEYNSKGIKPALDWVIIGGESGPRARPMHPYWAAGIIDQCRKHHVPVFFKQWGEWGPSGVDHRTGEPEFLYLYKPEEWWAHPEAKAVGNIGLSIDGTITHAETDVVLPVNFPVVMMRKNGKKNNGDKISGLEIKEFPPGCYPFNPPF